MVKNMELCRGRIADLSKMCLWRHVIIDNFAIMTITQIATQLREFSLINISNYSCD